MYVILSCQLNLSSCQVTPVLGIVILVFEFVRLDLSVWIHRIKSLQFSVLGFPLSASFSVTTSLSFAILSSNQYLIVSVSRLVVVAWYSSHSVLSLGTVVCSVEFCIVLDLIGFWFGAVIGRRSSVLKKGRDGRNSCTSCRSVTENCYPVLALSIPHPIPHPKKFSSVLSLFVSCHIRLSVYCPVATFGLLHSV